MTTPTRSKTFQKLQDERSKLIFRRSDALTITSPMTTGDEVRELQTALKNSRYGDLLKSEVDGEFGELTAAAVRRARWHAGYAQSKINAIYHVSTHQLIVKRDHPDFKPLPKAHALRRKLRIEAQRTEAKRREAAFALANSQLGIKESPAGSNRVKYTEWYDMIGAWCAMYTSWIGVSSSTWWNKNVQKVFKRGSRWAYVPYVEHDARSGAYGTAPTNSPQLMDLVTFDWDRNGVADHIGWFERWAPEVGPGYFYTNEGNTGSGSDSDGGQVQRRLRHTSNVSMFIRVPW